MEGIIHGSSTNDKAAEADFIAWYEDVVAERISMLEAEEGYKKRINELEQNNSELLHAFEGAQKEIKHIRTKYEPKHEDSELIYLEPYDKVLGDRERLKREMKELKEKLYEGNALIVELQNSLKSSNRTPFSSVNGYQSGSSSTSDDFELPALFQKTETHGQMRKAKSKRSTNNEVKKENMLLRTNIKKKITDSNEKLFSLVTRQDQIRALENENNSLKSKLKTVEHENEFLKLQIDAQLKKIKEVQNASKMYVDSFKKLNVTVKAGDTYPNKSEQHRDIGKMSSRDSYRSIFISKKISHQMSSISLPVIRKRDPKTLINSEILETYSFGGFRRSQSD